MRIDAKSLRRAQSGLSQIEAVVLTLGVLLLVALVWLMINQGRAKSQMSICRNNLKQIALGMQLFANDHRETTPPATSTNQLDAELAPSGMERLANAIQHLKSPRLLFLCPADFEAVQGGPHQPSGPTMSYFVSAEDSPKSQFLLAGDRNLTRDGIVVPSGILELSTNTVVGWSPQIHHFRGNVVVSDGSIQELNGEKWAEYLRRVGEPQSLVIP